MKIFIALLCMAAVANAAFEVTRGTIINRSVAGETCTADDYGFKCASCFSVLTCNGAENLANQTCPTTDKYCDSALNACTATKPADCEMTTSDFNCIGEGAFPNPNNCQTYFFCSAAKADAVTWECPANYVYDALNGFCKRKVYAADCVVIKCITANTFVAHTGNPNFYAFCNADLKPLLFQCPKNKQYSSGCKYVCKTAGYHMGSTKDEAYLCSKNGAKWDQSIYTCPATYEYNASFNCVKSPTV